MFTRIGSTYVVVLAVLEKQVLLLSSKDYVFFIPARVMDDWISQEYLVSL